MDSLTAAKAYAHLYHVERGRQMYGVVTYTHHLADVEEILRSFGIEDPDLLVASWLHDIVEDTEVKLRDVLENFGEDVAHLVSAVTNEPGENRKVRALLTYPKIREAGDKAIALKLADRIANTRKGGGSLKMYQREYPEFRRALYSDVPSKDVPSLHVMWGRLDEIMGWKNK